MAGALELLSTTTLFSFHFKVLLIDNDGTRCVNPPGMKDPHVRKNVQTVCSSQLEAPMEILSVKTFGLINADD